MALTLIPRRDPFAEFDTMIRRAFPPVTGAVRTPGDRRGPGHRPGLPAGFRPAVDIVRDGNDALIKLDIPGVDFESDIDVEVDGSTLTISGERRDPHAPAEGEATGIRVQSEVRYGAFRRAFTLPDHVTAEQLSAGYDAGILTVRVAGAYAGSEPRKIAVTAGMTAGESFADDPAAVVDAVDDGHEN